MWNSLLLVCFEFWDMRFTIVNAIFAISHNAITIRRAWLHMPLVQPILYLIREIMIIMLNKHGWWPNHSTCLINTISCVLLFPLFSTSQVCLCTKIPSQMEVALRLHCLYCLYYSNCFKLLKNSSMHAYTYIVSKCYNAIGMGSWAAQTHCIDFQPFVWSHLVVEVGEKHEEGDHVGNARVLWDGDWGNSNDEEDHRGTCFFGKKIVRE